VVVVTINDMVVELPDLKMAISIAMNLLEAAHFCQAVLKEAPDHQPESIFDAISRAQARALRKLN
jgi:hypothetical protein